MTTEHDAILSCILNDPWNDLTRLVYADWLDENGEPEHAEFVRTQIAIASEPGCYQCNEGSVPCFANGFDGNLIITGSEQCPARIHSLQCREHELWPHIFLQIQDDWLKFKFLLYPDCKLTRGFISSIDLPRHQLHHLPAIMARCPIERVTVEGMEFDIGLVEKVFSELDWIIGDGSDVVRWRWVCRLRNGHNWEGWPTRPALVADLAEWIESVLPRQTLAAMATSATLLAGLADGPILLQPGFITPTA